MNASDSTDISTLMAARAGVQAALEMHIRRSEELAGTAAQLDEEIEAAKAGAQE